MNDTTKWIMIILLLLLIAAAVFMLLRSPGKDNGDRDTATGRGAVDRGDSDRDGVPDSREGLAPADRGADRGVYDQEADVRRGDVREEATVAEQEHPVADREHHPVADRDRPVADRGEPVRSQTYEDTTTAPVESSSYDDTATTDVHPLSDDQVTAGGSDEPLTRQEQTPGASPADSTVDHHDGPDTTAAAAAGAAAAAAAGSTGTTGQDTAHERPVGEESTTYRATGGDAVVVDGDRADDGGNWTDTHAGPDTTTRGDTSGWDAPADTGYGAPQTADDIVEGRAGGDGATRMDDTSRVDDDGSRIDHTMHTGGAPAGEAAYAPVFTEAAYGPGSAEPLEDGSGPAGWEIKGNIGSMLFHTPESPSYDAVRAEVWFESEDAARTAGFAHWDRRRR